MVRAQTISEKNWTIFGWMTFKEPVYVVYALSVENNASS